METNQPEETPEQMYVKCSIVLSVIATLVLFTLHLSYRPHPDALTKSFCSPGADVHEFPMCAVSYGPWPAHHWILSSIAAALVIFAAGRVWLFMHRIESRISDTSSFSL